MPNDYIAVLVNNDAMKHEGLHFILFKGLSIEIMVSKVIFKIYFWAASMAQW